MNAKRLLPLALLAATDDSRIEGHTRLQKLVFLAQEASGEQPYEFTPDDYGPFSSGLRVEVEAMATDGLVRSVETQTFGGDCRHSYRSTDAGIDAYQDARSGDAVSSGVQRDRGATIHAGATAVIEEFGALPVSNLIGHVFDEYPEYAEQSVLDS